MNEEEKFYIDPVNKKIDIILAIIAVLLIGSIIYMYFAYKSHEETKILFDEKVLYSEEWVNTNEGIDLQFKDNKVTLTIENETVIDSKEYKFNNTTGEVIIIDNNEEKTGILYIRNVTSTSTTIWYNYAEYHLENKK